MQCRRSLLGQVKEAGAPALPLERGIQQDGIPLFSSPEEIGQPALDRFPGVKLDQGSIFSVPVAV